MTDAAGNEPELIERARSGDRESIAVLFEKHYPPARVYASRLTSDVDPDDAVAEAFVRVLAALRNGKGPQDSFRAYLFTAVRHQVIDQAARARREAVPNVEWDEPAVGESLSERVAQTDAVRRALLRLPERWREVLWRTEVEGLRPDELGAALGIRSHAATALAFRAREGFRLALLAESMPGAVGRTAACVAAREDLPRQVRRSLPPVRRRRVERHLDECRACADDLAALEQVNDRFRAVTGLIATGSLAPVLDVRGAGRSAPVRRSRATHVLVASASVAAIALAAPSLHALGSLLATGEPSHAGRTSAGPRSLEGAAVPPSPPVILEAEPPQPASAPVVAPSPRSLTPTPAATPPASVPRTTMTALPAMPAMKIIGPAIDPAVPREADPCARPGDGSYRCAATR